MEIETIQTDAQHIAVHESAHKAQFVSVHESAHAAQAAASMYIDLNGSLVCPSHVVRGFIETVIGFHPDEDEMVARHTPCVELSSGAIVRIAAFTGDAVKASTVLNAFLKSAYALHKAYWV
jgi:hypothetical protein